MTQVVAHDVNKSKAGHTWDYTSAMHQFLLAKSGKNRNVKGSACFAPAQASFPAKPTCCVIQTLVEVQRLLLSVISGIPLALKGPLIKRDIKRNIENLGSNIKF